MTIRMAFTGTGYISRIHAAAAKKLTGVEFVGVVNHRPESAKAYAAEFGVPRTYARIEELLADKAAGLEVDALIVSTPNYLHAHETIAALEAGLHVMVEKPMAMNADQARHMVEASQKTGKHLMVAHCWRFDPEVLWLHQQAASGQLGKIVRTKGYGVHVNWGPEGWFTRKELAGGGAMADMGIHAIDTARFLVGDPRPASVYARIETVYKTYDVDDTGLMFVNWDNGCTSYIESGWWQPYSDGSEAATQLYGTSGFGQVFPTRLVITSPDRRPLQTLNPGFPGVREPHCPQSLYDGQMAYFVNCIRAGNSPNPGGKEGLINMKIIDAAYESARSGEVVHL